MSTHHTTSQPPSPRLPDLLIRNPQFIDSAAGVIQLLLVISLVLTKQSLTKVKDRLKETVDNLNKPKKARTYLDPDQRFKSKVYQLAHHTLYDTKSSWVAIGIFSNGTMSEFGYHFSKLTYEYLVGTEVPLGPLSEIPSTALTSPFIESMITCQPPRVSRTILGFHTCFYPVTLGNIVVATLAVGYTDKPTCDPEPPSQLLELNQLFKDNLKNLAP